MGSMLSKKITGVVLYAIPIILMIGLIPFIENDYLLAGIYLLFIALLMCIKSERNDWLALVFGIIAITISEFFFVSTGVETFLRNSLFGLMPLWLPLLWGYAFVTIKRSLRILDR